MFWRLIWKQDKLAHFSTCGLSAAVLGRFGLDAMWTVAVVGAIAILVEVYQWAHESYYVGKETDTVLDLIVDGLGVAVGVMV